MNQIKLTYQEFLDAILQEIRERLGEEYNIGLNTILKNNSISMDGIIILKNGAKITPNIYLESYYQQYKKDGDLDNIIESILHEYFDKLSDKMDIDIQFTFQNMKDRIIYRVINKQRNKELLNECPYIEFLDLAATFHCLVQDEGEALGTIRITNEHLKQWNVDIAQVLECARMNTPKLMPPYLRKMEDVLKELLKTDDLAMELENIDLESKHFEEDSDITTEDQTTMYVLTNTKGINGATCLLYQNVIRNFSKLLKSDIYILPSSIHEIILLPAYDYYQTEQLEEMVMDINQTQVPCDEVLSDHVYYYSRSENKIKII